MLKQHINLGPAALPRRRFCPHGVCDRSSGIRARMYDCQSSSWHNGVGVTRQNSYLPDLPFQHRCCDPSAWTFPLRLECYRSVHPTCSANRSVDENRRRESGKGWDHLFVECHTFAASSSRPFVTSILAYGGRQELFGAQGTGILLPLQRKLQTDRRFT